MFKNAPCKIAVILFALLLCSCAATPGTTAATPAASAPPASTPAPTAGKIAFADANLENAVRFAISKPSGELTQEDLNAVTAVRFYGINVNMIGSLDGIERLVNLDLLDIEGAGLKDLRPLAGLKRLTSLTLRDNAISDIGPLKGLTGLKSLDLGYNTVENAGPLAAMTNLAELKLDFNKISDVSALKGLTRLQKLNLAHNALSGVGALGGMKALRELDVSGNFKIGDFAAIRGLEGMEKISADFLNRGDIGILESYPRLMSASVSGYVSRAKQAGNVDFSKFYETMDSADEILKAVVKPGMTDYEKECAVFGWVQENVHYGYVADGPLTYYSAYGALIRKRCECMGFSYTLNLLMNKAGVDCTSIHNAGHYWNIIRLGGGYYQVDASRTVSSLKPYLYFNMTDAQRDKNWDVKGYYPVCDATEFAHAPK